MKFVLRLFTICAGLALCFSNPSFSQGLHNDTKKFVPPSAMSPSDWTNPNELARTWNAALVRVPTGKGRSRKSTTSRLSAWKPSKGQKVPAVIYMHGSAGVWPGTHYRVKLMADLGFLVVAPASFAREKYAQSSDPRTHKCCMYRGVLGLRQNDAAFAIQQVRGLPYVDENKVVIMGLSEGGIIAATYKARSTKTKVTHRIIEGWTCHAGWPEYKGISASKTEPALSLVGQLDPWFQNKWTKGHCGPFMNRGNGSASYVFKSGSLASEHELLEHSQPRRALRQFLRAHQLIE